MTYVILIYFPEEFEAKHVICARTLVEAGFQYVTGEYVDGGKIFKKRK
jgi:hypothetical protein